MNKSSGELEVYDVTYTPDEFIKEMHAHGFEVISLIPVLRHFMVQSWISYTFDHRLGIWAENAVHRLENISFENPLEWIAICCKAR